MIFMKGDPGYPGDWKKAYLRFYGKELSDKQLLVQDEIFNSFLEMCSFFNKNFTFPPLKMIQVFNSMKIEPEKYKREWGVLQSRHEKSFKW